MYQCKLNEKHPPGHLYNYVFLPSALKTEEYYGHLTLSWNVKLHVIILKQKHSMGIYMYLLPMCVVVFIYPAIDVEQWIEQKGR